ncbi:hypothetical protein ON010_g19123 [Phytophthora cinnamomi]|nr:hypothetical protein ON010_g19123 [Phytophthora cinnamomi]
MNADALQKVYRNQHVTGMQIPPTNREKSVGEKKKKFQHAGSVSGRIVESRDVESREQWTVEGDYVSQLLEKVYSHQLGVVLPDTIPYVKLPLHDYTCSDSANEVAVASHDSGDESMDDQEVGDGVVGKKRARTSGMGEIEAAEAASIPKRHKCTGELALSDDAENSDDSLPASEDSIEYGDQQ